MFNNAELKEAIAAGVSNFGISLDAAQLSSLVSLSSVFIERGRDRGVTALFKPEDVVRDLIVDSLGVMPLLPDDAYVADLGSGGGVPGIPLALVRPDCHFLLVESNGRKCAWMQELIDELGLQKRVRVCSQRIEDLGNDKDYRARFDAVTAKALAALPSLIELAFPLLRVNSCLLAFKSINVAEEIAQSQKILDEMHGEVLDKFSYVLEDRCRLICPVKKLKPTPRRFPRRTGLAQHNPILS